MHHHNHHHGHDHSHHDHARSGNKRTCHCPHHHTWHHDSRVYRGLLTNSLALLSDSGHMLSDASACRSVWSHYGLPQSRHRRIKPMAFTVLKYWRLLNGVALFIIAGFIVWEAIQRFDDPPTVASGSMMLIDHRPVG